MDERGRLWTVGSADDRQRWEGGREEGGQLVRARFSLRSLPLPSDRRSTARTTTRPTQPSRTHLLDTVLVIPGLSQHGTGRKVIVAANPGSARRDCLSAASNTQRASCSLSRPFSLRSRTIRLALYKMLI